MVGIGLWQVLLQESQISIGRLVAFLGSVGGSGLGGSLGERWLLGVKFGQFRGEVGGESRGGRSLGLVEASDTAGCVGSLSLSAMIKVKRRPVLDPDIGCRLAYDG